MAEIISAEQESDNEQPCQPHKHQHRCSKHPTGSDKDDSDFSAGSGDETGGSDSDPKEIPNDEVC